MEDVKVYAVRSADGKYLRSRGYGGSGESWVEKLTSAKLWFKPGPAKAQITFWAKNYPQFGVPQLVTFNLVEAASERQEERVNKVIKAQLKTELSSKIKDHKRQVEFLQKAQKEIEEKLNKLKDEERRGAV